ncbi:MAG TPA: tetratricopeptide repeat protein, partial [Thermoanaerobaculia bacterium]|nr:tetratricopeptide repeat protein [Thermoanaerobaculia bacterium]
MRLRNIALLLILFVALNAAAADRLAGLADLIRTENASLARERLLEARAAYRAEKDVRGEARALILLTFANISLGESATAHADMEEAAAMLASADEPFGAWMTLFFVAAIDMEREHWEHAVKHHLAALEMLRQTGARPASLQTMADLAPLFGHPKELFDMLLQLLPPGSGNMLVPIFEMMNRNALARALLELGEFDRAEAELNRAGEISSRFFGMFDAAIAEYRGDLARRRWNFDEARAQYQKALGGMGMLPLPRVWNEWAELNLMSRLEDVEMMAGNPEAALAWNDKALEFVRKRRQRTRESSLLKNRGSLLMQAGRIPEALSTLERAESLAESVSDLGLQASILTDIGSLQMFQGDYGIAATTLERAIALYPFANDVRGESHAWMMLTEVYLSLAAYENTDVFMEKACALATRSDYPPALAMVETLAAMRTTMTRPAEDTNALGVLEHVLTLPESLGLSTSVPILRDLKALLEAGNHVRHGDVAGARQLFEKLLATSFNRDVRAATLAGIGAIYGAEGKNHEAIACFRQAADVIEETLPGIQDDILMARYLGAERRRYFDMAIESMLREGLVADAFDYTERARARAFLRTIGNHRVAARGADAEIAREAESLRTRIDDWNRNGVPVRTDLENARKRYATLLTRLKTTSPEYASLTHVEPLRAEAIRAGLPPETTLVSYFITVQGAHAFVVDRAATHHVRLPLDRVALQGVLCWAREFQPSRARGARPRTMRCEERAATAAEAFEWLIAPLRSKIRNRRLIIVPHDALHYIPFAALYDAERQQYLIESHTLTFAPSASALRFLRAKESPVTGRAVVLGDPESRSGELPGAKTEATVVARDL